MTPVTTFAGKAVALFGLGGSGLATALALKAGGAHVIAWDDNTNRVAAASQRGIETADLRSVDWSRFDSLLLSPGVPLTHPEPHWAAQLAKHASVEIIGDIELFCRERAAIAPDAPFIAITGTNGKSTTTALIAHILREAGRDVQLGGNIGTAILSLEPPSKECVHVVECSSFQIDLAASLAPSIGVMLNLSPDHLDRHGSMAEYAAIKKRLVAKADRVVIGVDDEFSRTMAESMPHAIRFGLVSDVHVQAGDRFVHMAIPDRPPFRVDLKGIPSLRGAHNAQNAAAAIAVAQLMNVDEATIRRAVRSFPGLPHRMEEVTRIGGTLFINDSKATNADSTEKALKSFENIYWILGGKQKEGGIEPLRPYFGKIRKAYLIGDASEAFAETLADSVPHIFCDTLDRAVVQAAQDAGAGVVLLSPACASYDQFPNYEVRGDRFRDLVRALPGFQPKEA
jgi:UDP-N-acetylmuramoylalanine--D-glutamate ligase